MGCVYPTQLLLSLHLDISPWPGRAGFWPPTIGMGCSSGVPISDAKLRVCQVNPWVANIKCWDSRPIIWTPAQEKALRSSLLFTYEPSYIYIYNVYICRWNAAYAHFPASRRCTAVVASLCNRHPEPREGDDGTFGSPRVLQIEQKRKYARAKRSLLKW